MKIKYFFTAISVSLFIHAAKANELDVANKYLSAYSKFDVKTMTTFYVDDSVFIDPTSALFGPDNTYHMIGKKAIVSKLESFLSSMKFINLDYDIQNQYETADFVVTTANMKITLGIGESMGTSCSVITTILHIKDGKVLEHRDYFNYELYNKTFKSGQQECSNQFAAPIKS